MNPNEINHKSEEPSLSEKADDNEAEITPNSKKMNRNQRRKKKHANKYESDPKNGFSNDIFTVEVTFTKISKEICIIIKDKQKTPQVIKYPYTIEFKRNLNEVQCIFTIENAFYQKDQECYQLTHNIFFLIKFQVFNANLQRNIFSNTFDIRNAIPLSFSFYILEPEFPQLTLTGQMIPFRFPLSVISPLFFDLCMLFAPIIPPTLSYDQDWPLISYIREIQGTNSNSRISFNPFNFPEFQNILVGINNFSKIASKFAINKTIFSIFFYEVLYPLSKQFSKELGLNIQVVGNYYQLVIPPKILSKNLFFTEEESNELLLLSQRFPFQGKLQEIQYVGHQKYHFLSAISFNYQVSTTTIIIYHPTFSTYYVYDHNSRYLKTTRKFSDLWHYSNFIAILYIRDNYNNDNYNNDNYNDDNKIEKNDENNKIDKNDTNINNDKINSNNNNNNNDKKQDLETDYDVLDYFINASTIPIFDFK